MSHYVKGPTWLFGVHLANSLTRLFALKVIFRVDIVIISTAIIVGMRKPIHTITHTLTTMITTISEHIWKNMII